MESGIQDCHGLSYMGQHRFLKFYLLLPFYYNTHYSACNETTSSVGL